MTAILGNRPSKTEAILKNDKQIESASVAHLLALSNLMEN
jgi:hypothetical protein